MTAVTTGRDDDGVPVHAVDRARCVCGAWGEALLVTRGVELRWEIVCLDPRCLVPGFGRLWDHGVCAGGCGRAFSGHEPYEPIPDHAPLCDDCLRARDGGAPTSWSRL